MSSLTWLNDLKIRVGWGKLGNQEVDNLAYLSPIDTRPTYAWGNNPNNVGLGYYSTAATVYSIPNTDLLWEKTETTNIGFDAVLLKNLSATVEYYDKITKGLLQEVALPNSVGVVNQPKANVGDIRNNGVELSLNYTGNVGQFTFNVGGNFTTVHNIVQKTFEDIPLWNGTSNNIEVGYPVNYIRGYKVGGIFQSQQELEDWKSKTSDDSYSLAKVAPGDMYFQDLRGAPTSEDKFYSSKPDSVVNNYDQVYLGKTIPGYFYGLNLGMSWKGFDLSVQFIGVGDVQKYNDVRSAMEYTPGMGNNISPSIIANSWTESNHSTTTPRIIAGDPAVNFRTSDRFVENAGYFRLNNLQLGYNFPSIEGIGLNHLRVYVGGSNLFTATKYTGLDPGG